MEKDPKITARNSSRLGMLVSFMVITILTSFFTFWAFQPMNPVDKLVQPLQLLSAETHSLSSEQTIALTASMDRLSKVLEATLRQNSATEDSVVLALLLGTIAYFAASAFFFLHATETSLDAGYRAALVGLLSASVTIVVMAVLQMVKTASQAIACTSVGVIIGYAWVIYTDRALRPEYRLLLGGDSVI